MLSEKRKNELQKHADWLQSEYMERIENAVDVCEAISHECNDELTLEEGNYIFEILGS